MSAESSAAKRYAKALFEVAREKGVVRETEADLQAVISVIRDNPDFEKLLLHPNIAKETKIDLLKSVFAGKIGEAVFNTLCLLITRGREEILAALGAHYREIANDTLGQAHAIVYTPYPLSEEEAGKIAGQFGAITGKKIVLEQVIDRSLLGGIRVRIGDTLYDGSLSGKLARLQRTLQQNQAI